MNRWQEKNVAQGLCRRCGQPRNGSKQLCSKCLIKVRKRMRLYMRKRKGFKPQWKTGRGRPLK